MGRHHAALGALRRLRCPRRPRPRSPAAAPNRSSSPAGHPPDSCTSPRTGPASGTLPVGRRRRFERVHPADADFGLPAWMFGMATYAFSERVHDRHGVRGGRRLAARHPGRRDRHADRHRDAVTPGSALRPRPAGTVAVTVAGPTRTAGPGRDRPRHRRGGRPAPLLRDDLDERYVSVARPIEFPTEDGLTAHGFYYPPYNADFEAPDGELPPLVVFSHGGPTSATDDTLKATTQFWTSRGFAVLDVNYGGSTGYGRAYWQRLAGQLGHRRHRRLLQRRALPRRPGSGRPASGWRSAAAAPAATPRSARSRSATCSRPVRATSASAT